MIDITSEVTSAIGDSGIISGTVTVYVPHTTAGITINENADPSVARDITHSLSELVPPDAGYSHAEGNADSHIKSVTVGPSITLIVDGGKPVLGTWQGVFFCEFDGPRSRTVYVQCLST
jgi:secondary thiamine-phosphate synthase enzyme